MLKKYISLILCLALLAGLCAACGQGADAPAADPEAARLSIVTTIFPIYDWVRALLGERASEAELTLLLDSGVDLHSYQPTAADILKVSTCDLFIYVGGESDEWVDDVLAEAASSDMVVINLLDVLGDAVKEEELVEGMEPEEEEEDGDEEEGPEYDEHVWLSLRNARVLCGAIADALCGLDPEHADTYEAELAAYDSELAALDDAYAEMVSAAAYDTVLFGDRFPFRYLVDDYGLSYYAAFVGCSAESEASFETIVFLAEKLDELGLPAILQIESSDGRIAETVRDNSSVGGQAILTLDSLQSTTAKDIDEGAAYLAAMEKNLDTLRQALGG